MTGVAGSIFCFLADEVSTGLLETVAEAVDTDEGGEEPAKSGSGVDESIWRAARWLMVLFDMLSREDKKAGDWKLEVGVEVEVRERKVNLVIARQAWELKVKGQTCAGIMSELSMEEIICACASQ